jgi:small-conductance mechanosensitive channel
MVRCISSSLVCGFIFAGAIAIPSPDAFSSDGGAASSAQRPAASRVAAAPRPDGGTPRKKRKRKKRAADSAGALDGGVAQPVVAPTRRKTERKMKRAMVALEQAHDQEEKTLRRLQRVKDFLTKGDFAAAMLELNRAERATKKAVDVTAHVDEIEILETSDYILRSVYSLGIALLTILLAVVLALLLRRLLTRSTPEGERSMGGAARWAYRLIVLIFSLGLLLFGTVVAVRYIWNIRVSSDRVIKVLEHPLFAFEGRPVTFLSIVFFLITLAFIVILARNLRGILERRIMPRFSADVGVQHAFAAILHYVIVFVGLLISLEVLGVGASTVAIVAGVVGIGVGFGMQHLVNNFLSGLVLFFERHVKVGDWIDVGGVEGKVVRIQARATTLLTRDHVTIVLPNSDLVQGKVVNQSFPDNRLRVRVRVGVAYGTDLELVQRTLYEVMDAHPRLLKEPKPQVRLFEFADSSLTIEALYWLGDLMGKDQIASEVRFAIESAFRANGIVIPFPQRDTHLLAPPELLQALAARGSTPGEPPRGGPGAI